MVGGVIGGGFLSNGVSVPEEVLRSCGVFDGATIGEQSRHRGTY